MTTTGAASQANSFYGQEYEYTKTDEFGRTISSGVASYEPMIGGEENSMKQPRYFGKINGPCGHLMTVTLQKDLMVNLFILHQVLVMKK